MWHTLSTPFDALNVLYVTRFCFHVHCAIRPVHLCNSDCVVEDVRFKSCGAILSLTDDIIGVNIVVEHKLVVDIVAALDDTTMAVQETALQALANVLREDDSAIKTALDKSVVATLLKLLKQGDVADKLVHYATLCLQHLGNIHEGKERILRDGALSIIHLLLDHPYEAIRCVPADECTVD